MVDANRATVNNEARLVTASAQFSCPLASSYLAVSVQDLMAADTKRKIPGAGRCGAEIRIHRTTISGMCREPLP